jgi:outer membrane cobalamin receptor
MGRYYRGYIVKNTRISNLKYAAAPLALGLALISTPSFAQDAAAEEETVEAIVVTGSLITNPNLERSAPVNVTSAEEMELLQSNLAEEVLREIPGVVA